MFLGCKLQCGGCFSVATVWTGVIVTAIIIFIIVMKRVKPNPPAGGTVASGKICFLLVGFLVPCRAGDELQYRSFWALDCV